MLVDIDTLADRLLSDEPSPQNCAESKEGVEAILKAVDTLKPKHKEVFWLRAVAELPFAKIAEILQVTEGSAKVIYFRAKNQLKKQLTQSIEYFRDD